MFARQIGVDLGTVNVLVYAKGRGIVLNEPSVVAISVNDNKIAAIGRDALAMLGRTPGSLEVRRPMRSGVIADYMVTEAMLRYFIGKVCGRVAFVRPEVMVSVPTGVTSVESRAVHDAAIQAGARAAYLIPEPLAAAIGAKVPIQQPSGNMIVNIGGGTTEAAVISLNGIVVSSSMRVGGINLDEAIAAYIKRKYNLAVGERTAEEVKIQIGSALPLEQEMTMEVRGRDVVAGLPRTITLTSGEATEAMADALQVIVNTVKGVLEKTPPELSSDVIDKGIVMTGGTSLLRNLDALMTREAGIPCHLAEDPLTCVANGAGLALEHYAILRRNLPPV
jgi:rod shape-determining protein MreB and related proteins